jgi:hypothetical protein
MSVAKEDPFLGQAIHVGCGYPPGPVATEVTIAEVVGVDEDYVGKGSSFL